MTLLTLPNELVIQILSHLTHPDLLSCQLSTKALYITIKHSVLLQFRIALSTFKATDNPSCHLSLAERFKALKDSEHAWTSLNKDFKRRIAVDFQVSGIYDLSAGVFLLGNATRSALHYVKLPSSVEDHVAWKRIDLDHSEGSIVDMGFCLYEHDLLAVVTIKPCHVWDSHSTYDIKITLLKLSTGEPHPAAKESTIHVLNSHWNSPSIGIEIVGDRLVLIITYPNNLWMPDDRVFVYDWRNALQIMSFAAPYCSYSGLVFLSENLIVIPNAQSNAFEIWDILSPSKTPHPTCILQLPELLLGNSLHYITCRGEPNPIGAGSHPVSSSPFHQSAHDAIILFHIRVQLGDPLGHQMQHGGELILGHTYTLFIHRKALCEIYDRQSNRKTGDLGYGTSAVQTEDSGWADSGLMDFELGDSASEDEALGLEMIAEDEDEDEDYDGDEDDDDDDDDDDEEYPGPETQDDVFSRDTNNDPTPLPWSAWGPPIAHWFPTDINSTQWITTTAGQRGILMKQSRSEIPRQYIVLDFNPESLRRLEAVPVEERPRVQCIRRWEGGQQMAGLFKEEVVGRLPFVVSTSENFYLWDGALLDEERVLGLEAQGGRIRVVEVHHFGGAALT